MQTTSGDPRYRLFSVGNCMPGVLDSSHIYLAQRSFNARYHEHPGIEIYYMNKGSGVWELKGHSPLRLCGGDVAIVQPGVLHQSQYGTMRPCKMIYLTLTSKTSSCCHPFLPEEWDDLRRKLLRAGNRVVRANPEMAHVFQALCKACASSGQASLRPCQIPWIRTLLSQLLILVVQSLNEQKRLPHSNPVKRARRLMEEHINDPYPISQIAKKIGMSLSHFRRAFHRAVGQSPMDYYLWLRCDRARQKLRESSSSITDIAFEFGFSSSCHFASCFRKYMNMTPSAYRKQMLS